MARPERLELPTCWFEARRSIRLSYGRALCSMVAEMSAQNQTTETEIKLRVPDVEDGVRRLIAAGFSVHKRRVFEANILLDTDDLALRGRSSLLRLRQAGDSAVLTFKGPSAENVRHKVREELEVQVSDCGISQQIFERLGFRKVFRYEKYRTEYHLQSGSGTATLDETPIGVFLELEGKPAWIDEQAVRLGFRESDYVTASYGRLYQDYCEQARISPSDMTF